MFSVLQNASPESLHEMTFTFCLAWQASQHSAELPGGFFFFEIRTHFLFPGSDTSLVNIPFRKCSFLTSRSGIKTFVLCFILSFPQDPASAYLFTDSPGFSVHSIPKARLSSLLPLFILATLEKQFCAMVKGRT